MRWWEARVKGGIQPFKAAEHKSIFSQKAAENKKVQLMTDQIKQRDIGDGQGFYFWDDMK